jgi:hypothetical protein
MQVTTNINHYIKIIARCEKEYKEADDKADKERDKLEVNPLRKLTLML